MTIPMGSNDVMEILSDEMTYVNLARDVIRFMGSGGEEYKRMVITICVSLTLASLLFLLMIAMLLEDRARDRKYGLKDDPDADLLYAYEYSADGVLCIYENACSIKRSGTDVSGRLADILNVSAYGDADDRVLRIVVDGGNTIDVHCGKMGDDEYDNTRKYMLQYAGG